MTRRTPTRSCALPIAALSVAMALGFQPADAARNLRDAIPADSHAAVWVNNLAELRAELEGNPFVQLLLDETHGVDKDLRALPGTLARLPGADSGPMEPIWRGLTRFAEDTVLGGINHTYTVFPVTLPDILEAFDGSLAISSTMYRITVESGTPITEWDLLLAAEYSEERRAAVERFLAKCLSEVPSSARRTSDRYLDEEVFHIEYFIDEEASIGGRKDDGLELLQEIPILIEYAWVDGVFLLAEGREQPLKKAVRALKEGGRTALAGMPAWQESMRLLPEGAGSFGAYVDIARQGREWQKSKEHTSDVRLLRGLGIDRSGPLLVAGTANAGGVTIDLALRSAGEADGVWKFFDAIPDNQLESVRRLPANALSFGVLAVDLAALLDFGLSYLENSNPGSGMLLTGGLKAIESRFGMKLREDVLASARGEAATYVRFGADETFPSGAIELPLARGNNVAEVVNRVFTEITQPPQQMLDLERADVDGVTVWETPEALRRQGASLHIATTSEAVYFATDGAELRSLLRSAKDGQQESLLANDGIRDLVRSIGTTGLFAFSMTPLDGLLRQLADTRTPSAVPGMPDFRQALAGFPKGLPDDATLRRHLGDSWWAIHHNAGGARFRYRIEPPRGSR